MVWIKSSQAARLLLWQNNHKIYKIPKFSLIWMNIERSITTSEIKEVYACGKELWYLSVKHVLICKIRHSQTAINHLLFDSINTKLWNYEIFISSIFLRDLRAAEDNQKNFFQDNLGVILSSLIKDLRWQLINFIIFHLSIRYLFVIINYITFTIFMFFISRSSICCWH